MCDACEKRRPATKLTRRRKLWEITGGWHCSILGTCLTLSDLRALGRKLALKVGSNHPIDYQFHGFFVKESCKAERPAKLLNKLLDKRHASAIRKLKDAKSESDLEQHWAAAREAGSIPGVYWAILSHPVDAPSLRERMFADVHMLSHLVGASNRADIRRLTALEEQVASLEEKLSKQHRRHHQRLNEKDREAAQLQEKFEALARRPIKPETAPPIPCSIPSVPDVSPKVAQLEASLAAYEATSQDQQAQIKSLTQQVSSLCDENSSLELALLRKNTAAKTACPFDLEGRCLLYVGGRQQTVHHLRTLVEEWNGQFLHHDGGIERSLAELARSVSKADAVVFPTDCVSHSAALKVKRLCHQTMKPFVPLRSSGIASFVAMLREGLDASQTS